MIQLTAPEHRVNSSIRLSGSKSISNRLLILNHILDLNAEYLNLSNSEDTDVLKIALEQIQNKSGDTIDIGHAGTDMRFLTAYLSVTEGTWTLTGSERMKERPVGELVNALKSLGATIAYLEKEGYPPLHIQGKKLMGGSIEIDSSVSSQFISALLLISPSLEEGLTLRLCGKVVSLPYIKMTLALLKSAGIVIEQLGNIIRVKPSFPCHDQNKRGKRSIQIESDWSSASYWYGICAFCKDAEIELSFLNKKSLQADSVLPTLYKNLGVKTTFSDNSIVLNSIPALLSEFTYDFTDCPDIAQTLAVTCFGLGIKAHLQGLSTLKVKETDRITALKTELEKFGALVTVTENSLQVDRSTLQSESLPKHISTYNDHRMAMSFAPLALLYKNVMIANPSVVNKSYPTFWEDLKSVGFSVTLQP